MKFFRREVSKVYWLPAVANLSAPSATEFTAGIDLSGSIAAISGFELTNSPIATPNLASSFTGSIPGEDTTGDPTLTLYDDDTVHTNRTTLIKGAEGFLVLCPYGKVATKRCEVWPSTSTGFNDQWTADNEAAKAQVKFAITAPPKQNASVTA